MLNSVAGVAGGVTNVAAKLALDSDYRRKREAKQVRFCTYVHIYGGLCRLSIDDAGRVMSRGVCIQRLTSYGQYPFDNIVAHYCLRVGHAPGICFCLQTDAMARGGGVAEGFTSGGQNLVGGFYEGQLHVCTQSVSELSLHCCRTSSMYIEI